MSAAKRPAPSSEPQPVDLSRSSLDVGRLMPLPRAQFRAPQTSPEPFVVQKTTIESRPVLCINGSPHDFSQLYVSLHELVKHIFPKVPVRSLQEILAVLGIYVFKATPDHLVVMNLSGCVVPPDRTVGLVRLTDLLTFMPQIGYMCSSESAKRRS
ncbi:uncharacterized protein LOC119099922 [Pollicipes pollicipes]|uniref:uncharacterized protein LOC119099922 n=1 Tax=Pollicipes pollicipes TaxID=41117 RepID=UPI00188585C3|nr:uncharacterized protein LOC119099922 [Pollicipes pollicipes]